MEQVFWTISAVVDALGDEGFVLSEEEEEAPEDELLKRIEAAESADAVAEALADASPSVLTGLLRHVAANSIAPLLPSTRHDAVVDVTGVTSDEKRVFYLTGLMGVQPNPAVRECLQKLFCHLKKTCKNEEEVGLLAEFVAPLLLHPGCASERYADYVARGAVGCAIDAIMFADSIFGAESSPIVALAWATSDYQAESEGCVTLLSGSSIVISDLGEEWMRGEVIVSCAFGAFPATHVDVVEVLATGAVGPKGSGPVSGGGGGGGNGGKQGFLDKISSLCAQVEGEQANLAAVTSSVSDLEEKVKALEAEIEAAHRRATAME